MQWKQTVSALAFLILKNGGFQPRGEQVGRTMSRRRCPDYSARDSLDNSMFSNVEYVTATDTAKDKGQDLTRSERSVGGWAEKNFLGTQPPILVGALHLGGLIQINERQYFRSESRHVEARRLNWGFLETQRSPRSQPKEDNRK
jgi:hypothetical protein